VSPKSKVDRHFVAFRMERKLQAISSGVKEVGFEEGGAPVIGDRVGGRRGLIRDGGRRCWIGGGGGCPRNWNRHGGRQGRRATYRLWSYDEDSQHNNHTARKQDTPQKNPSIHGTLVPFHSDALGLDNNHRSLLVSIRYHVSVGLPFYTNRVQMPRDCCRAPAELGSRSGVLRVPVLTKSTTSCTPSFSPISSWTISLSIRYFVLGVQYH
jgi:hypothetical protein